MKEAVGIIKENMELRRFGLLSAGPQELVLDYIHGEGRLGVLVKVALSSAELANNPRVKEVAFELALHVAAFAPLFLSRDKVPAVPGGAGGDLPQAGREHGQARERAPGHRQGQAEQAPLRDLLPGAAAS